MATTSKNSNQPPFRELSAQLDDILAQLQRDDIDVDAALELYEKGRKLTEQLEKRLSQAEQRVVTLKSQKAG